MSDGETRRPRLAMNPELFEQLRGHLIRQTADLLNGTDLGHAGPCERFGKG